MMDTKKLRQKILDLAIRGKLVPQDPNDEPASVLLKRIRAEKERLIKEGKIKRSKNTVEDTSENGMPFEVPSNWTICKLGEIAYIGTGATPDTRNKEYYNGNIPWVSSSCTKNDYIDSPTSYISQKAINETNCQIYPNGTLIMAMYGEGKTRGQISELRIDAATNQACAAIVPYLITSTQYIKLYLRRSYLNIRQQAEGGLQPNLNLSKISQYDIPLPPLAEQKRIVSEIECWFAVIDELERNEVDLLKAIDKAKSKILDLAIQGKLVPQDPNDEPASVLLNRIREEKKQLVKEGKLKKKDLEETPISEDEIPFDIPDSWEWVRIGNLTNILNGFAFKSVNYTNEGVRIIRITNVQDGKIVDDDPKYYPISEMDNIQKYLLKEGDLLMSLTGNVGRVGIIGSNLMPAALNQRVACLRLYMQEIQSFLYMYLQSEHFKSRCIASGKGMAQLNISTDWLGDHIIPLPPLAEQKRIVAKIEEVFKAIDALS